MSVALNIGTKVTRAKRTQLFHNIENVTKGFHSKQDLLQFPNYQRKTFVRQTKKELCLDLFRRKESLAVNNMRENSYQIITVTTKSFRLLYLFQLQHFLFHRFRDK